MPLLNLSATTLFVTHVLQIEELEQELTSLHKLSQYQARQMDGKDAEISSLKSQLATWRAVKDAEAASLNNSNKQLADQLAKEIAKSRTLESQLSRAQTQWVRGSNLLSCQAMQHAVCTVTHCHVHAACCMACQAMHHCNCTCPARTENKPKASGSLTPCACAE